MEGKNKDNLPSNSLDASSTSSSPDNAVRVDDNKNLFTVEERQNTSDEQVLKPFTEITSSNDCPGGLAVRVATTILQPICLGDGPFMLPIHLHTSQVSQAGGSPYLTANPSPVSLPLLLEQQVFQHLSPFTLHQGDLGASMSLQNNIPCHNSPLSMKQIIPPFDQTSSGSLQEPRTMPFLKGPDFAAVLQDPFSNQSSHYTTFQQRTSSPANSFSHLAPSHTYPSTLSSLVPPPTLMVPYPVVIPLPVPLPIPIPFPIPVPQNGHLKDLTNPTKPKCHLDKTTQTAFQENCSQPQVISLSDTNAEALDLSVKTLQVLPKPEAIVQQDRALDLSLASTRKPYYGEHHSQKDQQGSSLSLEILQPMEYAQNIDSQILNSLASLEFNQQHKWMLDSSKSESSCEIVTTSQTAKVIVAVKDAVPAIFCGKLKDLSGMSTKNFSFKRDACQEVTLQQCYSIKAQREDRNHDNLHKKPSRNKSNQLRKAGSREVHILPIKKQRLDFFPRE